MDKALENLEKSDTIDVDEAVTTTAPLYRQYVKHNTMNMMTKYFFLLIINSMGFFLSFWNTDY